jgi:hypothetical protein
VVQIYVAIAELSEDVAGEADSQGSLNISRDLRSCTVTPVASYRDMHDRRGLWKEATANVRKFIRFQRRAFSDSFGQLDFVKSGRHCQAAISFLIS